MGLLQLSPWLERHWLLLVVTALIVVTGLVGLVGEEKTPSLPPQEIGNSPGKVIERLREIHRAQQEFYQHQPSRKRRFAESLDELVEAKLLDPDSRRRKYGYFIKMQIVRNRRGFEVLAYPQNSYWGRRKYYLDETGRITYTEDEEWPDRQSPQINENDTRAEK